MNVFLKYIRSVNLKDFFTSIGLEELYEFLRANIIIKDMTFMVLCAFLFLMIFAGYQFDSLAIKLIAIFLLVFFMFFRLTIMF